MEHAQQEQQQQQVCNLLDRLHAQAVKNFKFHGLIKKCHFNAIAVFFMHLLSTYCEIPVRTAVA